ncbi:hypothetical protein JNUCC1_00121 [Lentibacillus sp. JNUCC-1]|nr:hypothetical protein [Lentibacillus sp. JNUCC-1]
MKKGTLYTFLMVLASVVGYVYASRKFEDTRDFR